MNFIIEQMKVSEGVTEDMNVTVFSSMTGEGVQDLRRLIEEITVPVEMESEQET